ncbi:AsnC family transcriptional regulator [Novosphingobium sp. Rr 2-17]|uniref:Lrp/AsnC family transcriptional regulator n=1 Tax=Novosphingobium sp. Rr 2-17 TaxID=555793 RepID=UPI0002698EDB|nr:Lrp/AsnC family transcriptional regulator [Novosphingobium sp. Rr 2-17]EIZ79289.1 AsnC family transcriptional regulator [Novosphingobium sp. Rr 2-17]
MTENADLDSFDYRIIDSVRRNNLEPARTIADRVGLSESAVLRRLRRLRSIGVIIADVALIDPARLKPSITIHVLVELHQSNLRAEHAFTNRIQQRSEVIGAWNVTGKTDFLLIVAVASIEEYQQFSDEVLAASEDVRMFETLVSLREIVRFDPSRANRLT